MSLAALASEPLRLYLIMMEIEREGVVDRGFGLYLRLPRT